MHEGAVMQGVIKTILASLEQAGASRVTGVQLAVGTSSHFTKDVVRQYFQVLTQQTPIEGAALTLTWLPATYQCLGCQQRFESTSATDRCLQCGDVVWEIAHQDVCYVCSIDVITDEA